MKSIITVLFNLLAYSLLNAGSNGFCFIENKGQIVNLSGKQASEVIGYGSFNGTTAFLTKQGISFVSYEDASEPDANYSGTDFYKVNSNSNISAKITRSDIEFTGLELKSSRFLKENSTVFNFYLAHCKDGILGARSFLEYEYSFSGTDAVLRVFSDGNKLIFAIIGPHSNQKKDLYDLINRQIKDKYLEKYCSVQMDYSPPETKHKGQSETQGPDDQLIYSSFIGGSDKDELFGLQLDDDGSMYIAGTTKSPNYPTTVGAFQKDKSNIEDQYIMCIDKNFKIKWCTYIGGTGEEKQVSLVLANNSLYIGGNTTSIDYPVSNDAYKKINEEYSVDCTFGCFSKSGQRIYLSYFGGNNNDYGTDMAVDKNNNIIIGFETGSTNIPVTKDAFKKTFGNDFLTVAIAKFDQNWNLVYCSYWGGSNHEFMNDMVLDNNGNIIICGFTTSADFPVKNALQSKLSGLSDGYITKFDSSFNLCWSTYLGGSDYDDLFRVQKDSKNNIIVLGYTPSCDFLVTDKALQDTIAGKYSWTISKFNEDGGVIWSSYFGNCYFPMYGGDICIDKSDNIAYCVSADTKGYMIGQTSMQKELIGKNNIYLLITDKNCKYLYSTYLGNGDSSYCRAIEFNSQNDLVIGGMTNNESFKVTDNAYQRVYGGGKLDGVLCVLDPLFIKHDSCDESGFTYQGFSYLGNMIQVGDSRIYEKDKVLSLTSAKVNLRGSAWHKFRIPVKNGFETWFTFKLSDGYNTESADNSLPGADGIAFVIQNNGLSAIGGNGGRIGYDPIPNSLAVEYDLFSNDENQIEILNDPNGNHVAVMSLGREPNSSNHKSGAELGINKDIFTFKSNYTVYYSKIDYNIEPGVMRVYLSDKDNDYGEPALVIDSLDLARLLELNEGEWAYVGFTSATGSSYQKHDLLSWEFCPKPTDSQQTGIDENEPVIGFGDDIIFPNPAEDILFVNTGKLNISRVQIVDLTGLEVMNISNIDYDGKINISDLAAGCWLMKIETFDGKILIEKFLKK